MTIRHWQWAIPRTIAAALSPRWRHHRGTVFLSPTAHRIEKFDCTANSKAMIQLECRVEEDWFPPARSWRALRANHAIVRVAASLCRWRLRAFGLGNNRVWIVNRLYVFFDAEDHAPSFSRGGDGLWAIEEDDWHAVPVLYVADERLADYEEQRRVFPPTGPNELLHHIGGEVATLGLDDLKAMAGRRIPDDLMRRILGGPLPGD